MLNMRLLANMLVKLITILFLSDWAYASCSLEFINSDDIDQVLIIEIPADTSATHTVTNDKLRVTQATRDNCPDLETNIYHENSAPNAVFFD